MKIKPFKAEFFSGSIFTTAVAYITAMITHLFICDPPRENRGKGECTGTRAMTRHAKRVTIAQICAYLISKTKSGTVRIVWQSKAAFTRQTKVGKLVLENFKMLANTCLHTSNSRQITTHAKFVSPLALPFFCLFFVSLFAADETSHISGQFLTSSMN